MEVDGRSVADALRELPVDLDVAELVARDAERTRVTAYKDALVVVLGYPGKGRFAALLRGDTVAVAAPRGLLARLREDFEKNSYGCRSSPDAFLALSLLRLIDEYYAYYDALEDEIDGLEDSVAEDPTRVDVARFRRVRGSLVEFRRDLYSLRAAASLLLGEGVYDLSEGAKRLVQEVYEDAVQLLDMVESQKERLADIRDLHLSALSLALNEVMKKLTAINVIALPLLVIAGIYGMNLEIPEARWPYAYPAVLTAMATLTAILAYALRKRGWL
ncbi:Mg2+ transporter protein, CorA family protein [Thermofilum pendens Hrk 5]|uniref:Mg2+ transporter protein, CorA family protein n=1 Tax=Thermofilum pendens (strain DSM 2475 / Hrk 5) TaxID=368408 RepID=A1S0A1_THEPD|nr:Mg2+ transporter protein, CorA family protein [Thermofilum pendens Hrk 5]